MSSAGEEQDVADLAQAINSHADVLYESWRSNKDNNIDRSISAGPPPVGILQQVERPLYDIIALKRMEDTLELLADPSLTPKLEHLVSNFVRKDKAKRQHGSPSPSPSGVSSRRSSSPVKIIPIQKENGVMVNGVGHNPKKPLPKSILAAVQRFEPSESSSDSDSAISGNIKTSHSSPTVNLPGIGLVSRDIIQGESSLSNRVSEKTYRLKSPIRTILNNHHSEGGARVPRALSPQTHEQTSSSNNYFYERQLRKSNSNNFLNSNNSGGSREIHIPIERIDENGARSKIIERKSASPAPDTSRKPSRHQFENYKDDLEREEEKLVQALRTGQITNARNTTVSPTQYLQNRYSPGPAPAPAATNNLTEASDRASGRRQSPIRTHRIEVDGTPYHSPDGTSSNHIINDNSNSRSLMNGNGHTNSRIAFAKERIRQSQEHPLTQQRLELQKQLPSPSSSLAAAIAVQQGKIKFQPPSSTNHLHQHQSHFPPHEDGHQHHPRLEHQNSRENGSGTGRQNWVSNMLKFGPSGSSSVAERVQLFEKYPAHVPMGNLSSTPRERDSSKDFEHVYGSKPSDTSSSGSSTTGRVNETYQKPLSINIKPQNQNEYYASPSSPVSTPSPLPLSPPHSPREITHTIRTSPDITLPNSQKPVDRVEIKLLQNKNNNTSTSSGNIYAHGDSTSVMAENSVLAPWRHGTIATIQHDLSPRLQSQVKPGSPKSTRFGVRGIVPTRLGFSSDIDLIGDGNNNKPFTLPRFYWAEGKLPPTSYVKEVLTKAQLEYNKLKGTTPLITEAVFGQYITALGIPLYWKKPFWLALGPMQDDNLDFETFLKFYHTLVSECPDDASRFIRILWTQSKMTKAGVSNNQYSSSSSVSSVNESPKSEQLRPNGQPELSKLSNLDIGMSDFIPMIQDIIDTHPGLGFLREAPEFHSRYVTTVVSRIFYMVNRSWTGRITLQELRRSNILRVIRRLEEETDVNNITEYFSYEHFYVIYCKFWELDKDHDLLIDRNDLSTHSDHALSSRIIDRIFSGAVIRGWDMTSTSKCSPGKMTYSDFVWFLISEEDKKTPTAIEYWFRCLDIDGDGMLSSYELQYFYSEQEKRIECLGIDPLDFSNIYCQIIDMLRCSPTGIRLKDLKKNPQLASNIFNTLFNLDKYLDHEQRDPFSAAGSGPNLSIGETGTITHETESDWDKYAAMEYDLLIAEETPSDAAHDTVSDFEDSPGSPGSPSCHAP